MNIPSHPTAFRILADHQPPKNRTIQNARSPGAKDVSLSSADLPGLRQGTADLGAQGRLRPSRTWKKNRCAVTMDYHGFLRAFLVGLFVVYIYISGKWIETPNVYLR